jgi:transcriptional regulator with XRE-family HTH domain
MIKEEKLRKIIAKNLTYYRKEKDLTQFQLAEKLGYSDKAISKWERGESIPDIYTLYTLADLYRCDVFDLLEDKEKTKRETKKNKFIISLMAVGLVWLTATVIFMFWSIIGESLSDSSSPYWITWIYAILASFIVAVIFAKIWGKRWQRFIFVSGIIWSVGLILVIHLNLFSIPMSWLVWIVCSVLQALTILWYCLSRKRK